MAPFEGARYLAGDPGRTPLALMTTSTPNEDSEIPRPVGDSREPAFGGPKGEADGVERASARRAGDRPPPRRPRCRGAAPSRPSPRGPRRAGRAAGRTSRPRAAAESSPCLVLRGPLRRHAFAPPTTTPRTDASPARRGSSASSRSGPCADRPCRHRWAETRREPSP